MVLVGLSTAFAIPLSSHNKTMNVLNPTYAQKLDANDSLAHFRNEFYLPMINGKQTLYFTGNSLGLMPKLAEKYLNEEIEDWKKLGVEGHMRTSSLDAVPRIFLGESSKTRRRQT